MHVGIYAVIMAITSVLIPAWRYADWHFFSLLHRGSAAPVSDDIVIVDVPYHENLAAFRSEMSMLLGRMAEKPDNLPKLVVLDTWISADTSGLSGLKKSLRQLTDVKVPVYAGVNPTREGNTDEFDPEYMNRHAGSFYAMLDGHGHTRFEHIAGVVKYNPKLEFNLPSSIEGSQYVQALPVMLAMNHYGVPATSKQVVVNLGDIEPLRQRILTFRHQKSGRTFFSGTYNMVGSPPVQTTEPSFRGKIVIVGSLHKDRNKFEQLAGPEVLASAINERIFPKNGSTQPELLENPWLLLAMVVTFAVLSALLFRFLYRKLPPRWTRMWVIASLSMCAALLLLVLWVWGFFLLNLVYTQVTLVAISVAVSTGLSWFSVTRYTQPKQVISAGEKMEYDVFISYARTAENSAWVKAQIYERLLKLRKADGTSLRVFFDQRDIEPGEDWYKKLALAIQGSRFFLPVYTADYFTRKFCEFEMELAAIRHVELGDFIVAIARDDIKVPFQYFRIQYLDVRTDQDFMERVAQRIMKREAVVGKGEEKQQ